MEILGTINDISIPLSDLEENNGKKIKIRTIKSDDDETIIDNIELIIDEKGKIALPE